MKYTLPRCRMLRAREQMDTLYQTGRRFSGPGFTVIALPNRSTEFHFAVLCGRKLGNAVVRNRWRRRIREIVRSEPDLWSGLDFLVTLRPSIRKESFQTIRTALTEAGKQARP